MPVRLGSEFRVNTYTPNNQRTFFESPQSVAMDDDGDFVVTWSSYQQEGSFYGVYAQRYNTAGVAQGPEFRVNTTIADTQQYSTVAMDADGDFVVTWSSLAQDGSGFGVFAQRYNAAGVRQGSEFQVNSTIINSQQYSTVAMDASGDFVVTWTSFGQDGSANGVFAQRYNAAGVRQGPEFQVNSNTGNSQQFSTVAIDDTGDFVVTWTSYAQDGSGAGVFAKRYNAAGVAQSPEFRVNSTISSSQQFSTVAMDASGDFVVTWSGFNQDGSGAGVFAQRYNAAGQTQGGEFRVNTFPNNNQLYSTVAMDSDGDFVVTWTSYSQDGSGNGVFGRRYDAAGVPQGGEFRVNVTTTNNQQFSSIAMDADGDFVVDWSSEGQDGSGFGIYAQRYQLNAAPVLDLNGPATGINYNASFTENAGAVAIVDRTNLSVSDADDTNLESATVTLTNRPNGAMEVLAANTANTGITASYNPANGTLSLSGSASVAAYQQVLRSVTYNNTSDNPTPTARNITFVVNDGTTSSPVATTTLAVNAVNDPPVLDLNGPAAGINYNASFRENAGAVAIVDRTNLSVSDADNINLQSATVRINNRPNGAMEVLAANTANTGITASYNPATGTLSLSGSASVAAYQQVLRSVTYNNTSDTPTPTARNITFVVNDGTTSSPVATTTLAVNAVNDAPVLKQNGGLTINERTTATITNSQLQVTDADNSPNQITFKILDAPDVGLLNLNGTRLAVNSTFTQADINANRLSYANNPVESFSDKFTFTFSDGASAQIGPSVFNITVNPVDELLNGTAGNDTLNGLRANDTLNGFAGSDTLNGNSGNDTLTGGDGNDVLTGAGGADRFTYNSPNQRLDTIRDFVAVDDTIVVSAAGFGGRLTPGAVITPQQFTLGTAATASSHRFIYNNSNGALIFDIDGISSVAPVQIATLSGIPSITNADIFVNP